MTKQLMIVCLVFSGCSASGIKNPDANVYVVQAADAKLRGYNLRDSYDSDGNRKPNAKVIEHRGITSIQQLDGYLCSDPVSAKRIQVFGRDVRDYINDNCTCK